MICRRNGLQRGQQANAALGLPACFAWRSALNRNSAPDHKSDALVATVQLSTAGGDAPIQPAAGSETGNRHVPPVATTQVSYRTVKSLLVHTKPSSVTTSWHVELAKLAGMILFFNASTPLLTTTVPSSLLAFVLAFRMLTVAVTPQPCDDGNALPRTSVTLRF